MPSNLASDRLIIDRRAHGVVEITLNSPANHNAFDEHMIAALTAAFAGLGDARAVLLRGAGKSFCAGADLNWMQRMAALDQAANEADARLFAAMLLTLRQLPVPTVALVHGAAFGGGVGLAAACDIAIAHRGAKFSLSEVKLGLIPAVISPYVLGAIGPRHARRLMLTGEVFDAATALRVGLVSEVADDLDAARDSIVDLLLQAGPAAQAEVKTQIVAMQGRTVDDATASDTARRIAEIRATPEGREGVNAFLERRPPAWRPKSDS